MSAIIGNDLVIFSGFTKNYFGPLSSKVFALDLTSNVIAGTWREMDSMPIVDNNSGVTHGGFVVIDTIVIICGGYVGIYPGPATSTCFYYNHQAEKGAQWGTLPSLPLSRSGGGLFYDELLRTLYYTTGAARPDETNYTIIIDHADTWALNLGNTAAGWISMRDTPYIGNHIGFTTVKYRGIERHYIMGGQIGDDEINSNLNYLYEYLPKLNQWIPKAKLPIGRGHFASSVIPWNNCGFSIAGGSTNLGKTSEITYYDITTDTWTKIGDLPQKIDTPACVIAGEYYYCQTGNINGKFSWRRKIM